MIDKKTPESRELDALGERLKRGREEAGLTPVATSSSSTSMGAGFKVAIEFVVSTMVGTGLGYAIGYWLGAPVIGIVLGMVVGFAAGLRQIIRGTQTSFSETGQTPVSEEEEKRNDGPSNG